MRFLIFFKTALLRHFDTTFLELADRGHELVFASPHGNVESKIPGELVGHENVRLVGWKIGRTDGRQLPTRRHAAGTRLSAVPRPELRPAYANRERAWQKLLGVVSQGSRDERVPGSPLVRSDANRATGAENGVRQHRRARAARSTPMPVAARASSRRCSRDSLITLGSRQSDIVAAAKALGVPCGLLVFSWDNLSNKGVMHVTPDATFVWNELQKREAVEMHGVPPESVVVTGAPRFDEFIAMEPTARREPFLTRNGLDPARRTILYLGSAPFVSTAEPTLVTAWLDSLRSSQHAELREANVFIRPHPRTRGVWMEFDPTRWTNVVCDLRPSIHRLGGLYNQITRSDAVVGLNTSAQIEAAILGKPVYTFDAGDLAPGQEGSSHYYYLLRENGGIVEHGRTMAEHLDQLAAGLRGEFDPEAHRCVRRESFVRPRGLDLPATPILVDRLIAFAERDLLRGPTRRGRGTGRRPPAAPDRCAAGRSAPRDRDRSGQPKSRADPQTGGTCYQTQVGQATEGQPLERRRRPGRDRLSPLRYPHPSEQRGQANARTLDDRAGRTVREAGCAL